MRYKLVECIDEDASGSCIIDKQTRSSKIIFDRMLTTVSQHWCVIDSDESYDTEEDDLQDGFLERVEPDE